MKPTRIALDEAIREKYTFKPYSKEYEKIFAFESKKINKALKGIKEKVIEHVGSTAIKGVGGKGSIDILVFVPQKGLAKSRKLLEKCGFYYHANWRGRRYFFGKTLFFKNKIHFIHVHLTTKTKEMHKLLAMVNYLKKHKSARKKYEAYKRKASRLYSHDGDKYRKFKRIFLSKLAKKALTEYMRN